MSEANTDQGQGRFGPAPLDAISMSVRFTRGEGWTLVVNAHYEGERPHRRELVLTEARRSDVLEGAVVELYRLLGRG